MQIQCSAETFNKIMEKWGDNSVFDSVAEDVIEDRVEEEKEE